MVIDIIIIIMTSEYRVLLKSFVETICDWTWVHLYESTKVRPNFKNVINISFHNLILRMIKLIFDPIYPIWIKKHLMEWGKNLPSIKGKMKSECFYEIIDFPKHHQKNLIDFCPESLFRLGVESYWE